MPIVPRSLPVSLQIIFQFHPLQQQQKEYSNSQDGMVTLLVTSGKPSSSLAPKLARAAELSAPSGAGDVMELCLSLLTFRHRTLHSALAVAMLLCQAYSSASLRHLASTTTSTTRTASLFGDGDGDGIPSPRFGNKEQVGAIVLCSRTESTIASPCLVRLPCIIAAHYIGLESITSPSAQTPARYHVNRCCNNWHAGFTANRAIVELLPIR